MHLRTGPIRLPRKGFTLLEVLVVISIIALLAGLITAAANRALVRMDAVRVRYEISQLETALAQFKLTFGRYPPSRIVLSESGNYDPDNPHQYSKEFLKALQYSKQYLQDLFPGINLKDKDGHDWDGDGVKAPPDVFYDLQGQECLVFFLGGIPFTGIGPSGFSTVKTKPTLGPTDSKSRLGPFFEFDTSRLKLVRDVVPPIRLPNDPVSQRFYVYLDRYGSPYAYFLARDAATDNYLNDCPDLVRYFNDFRDPLEREFRPYVTAISVNPPVVKYHRPNSFQIVSAGKDKKFGFGGLYVPNDDNPQLSVYDYDNITNFSEGLLVPR